MMKSRGPRVRRLAAPSPLEVAGADELKALLFKASSLACLIVPVTVARLHFSPKFAYEPEC